MKKNLCLLFSVLVLFLLSACGSDKTPYPVKSGTYELNKAVITDIYTKETTEISVDDLFSASTDKEWRFLLSFWVVIDGETEFIYTEDDRCVVLNEGLAFELTAENSFKIQLSRWKTSSSTYDITVFLSWAPRY